jgi:hypothetical protein
VDDADFCFVQIEIIETLIPILKYRPALLSPMVGKVFDATEYHLDDDVTAGKSLFLVCSTCPGLRFCFFMVLCIAIPGLGRVATFHSKFMKVRMIACEALATLCEAAPPCLLESFGAIYGRIQLLLQKPLLERQRR